MVRVTCEKSIPLRTPKDFDDVPSSAGKKRFEFLDDLSIAAHRAVQALQIAIDDKSQIVEVFAGCEGEASDRLRFVHFPVAENAPHVPPRGVLKSTMIQIAHESGLIDGIDWTDAH